MGCQQAEPRLDRRVERGAHCADHKGRPGIDAEAEHPACGPGLDASLFQQLGNGPGSHRVAADHAHQQGAAGFGRQVKDPPADRFQGAGDPFPQPGGGEHPRKDQEGEQGGDHQGGTGGQTVPDALGGLGRVGEQSGADEQYSQGPGCPEQGLERCRGSRAAACIFGCRHTESLQSVACQVILFSPGPYNHTKGR